VGLNGKRRLKMGYIYTCQQCGKQYTVYEEGDYICNCGDRFHYPSATSSITANYIAEAPAFLDSSSRSIKRQIHYNRSFRPYITKVPIEDCPLAKASLICALLSLPFFGILALPSLLLGFSARVMISNPNPRYTGDGIAVAGIIIATISSPAWGMG
jgi:hypothetical protein